MNHHPTTIALVAALLGGAVAGCANPDLAVPYDETPLMTITAQGVQTHECRATPGAAPAWTLVAPEADLFDAEGRRIGHHGAGPFWQHQDGSGFVGTVRARAKAPRPHSIPWLLLATRSLGPEGAFARVSSVQRLNTVGGEPPADGCGPGTLGAHVHMAYRADYVLYVAPL